ncbi:MAG: type II secretion system GspH family protein, partial [Chromatiales bacterium]|nr:type II secretion system GspH family protein [Chromatiales bacterium]
MNMKKILKQFDRIDAASIEDNKLAKRVSKLQAKRKQGGFTLLELLVVVAILAAIAGTATIALQDTDARASAAAHVAMMDELNKGIRTFRVLNKN